MKANEELEQRKIYNCPECKCALGNDWDYLDFSNKNIIVCPQCKHQIHSEDEETDTNIDILRLQKLIHNNKFNNDLAFNERGRENLVFELVIAVKFNKTKFWEIAKEKGLVKDDVNMVENILSQYKIILKEDN